ncbi:MAG: hypothetical protein ACLQNE_17450 [Thermoguttaceae bacterium]
MKILVALTALLLLVVLCGCGKKEGPSGTTTSGGGQAASVSDASVAGIPVKRFWKGEPNDAPKLTELDKEAANLMAMTFWQAYAKKSGESHYVCRIRGLKKEWLETSHWKSELRELPKSKAVCELKEVAAHVDPISLTEADKLNGLQWRGTVIFSAEAHRWYVLAMLPKGKQIAVYAPDIQFDPPIEPEKKWGMWQGKTAVFGLRLLKKNGKWENHGLEVMLAGDADLAEGTSKLPMDTNLEGAKQFDVPKE